SRAAEAFAGAGWRRSLAGVICGIQPSLGRLPHIALLSLCTDRRYLSSLRAIAQLTQLESRATRDVSAAEAAPAARAEFLQDVSFGWLRSFNAFFVGNNSFFAFAFAIMRGIGRAVFLPVIGQTQQFPRWHLDQCEHL